MTMHPRNLRKSAAQRGFTLVELMVAVALGLLIMVALIAVYLNVSRTNAEMAKTNSLIENGRFSIDIVSDEVGHAGFWGGYVPLFDDFSLRNVVPTDVPQTATLALGPCLAYSSWDADYRNMLTGIPVEVYAGVPTGCGAVVTDRKAGTDVLVVRHADTCWYVYDDATATWNKDPDTPNCENYDSDKVHFQASFCATETGAAMPLRYVLYNNPTNDASLHALKRRGCTGTPPAATAGTRAWLRRFVSNIYYVRTWAVSAGDGVPTLVRATFTSTGGTPGFETNATALIEGIENMAVELGIDTLTRCTALSSIDYTQAIRMDALPPTGTGNLVRPPPNCTYDAGTTTNNTMPLVRGDGVPDQYVRCGAGGCTANELRDVVAVKLYVLARSRDTSPGHVDDKTYTLGTVTPTTVTPAGDDQKYKRHVFQTTVRLNNVSARRETP